MTTPPAIGSKVQLICGGPVMVVSHVHSNPDGSSVVKAAWFNTMAELRTDHFSLPVLVEAK